MREDGLTNKSSLKELILKEVTETSFSPFLSKSCT